VVQVRAGNCSVSRLIVLIREHAARIAAAVQMGESLLEVNLSRSAAAAETTEPPG
jgi:hypothetical protein